MQVDVAIIGGGLAGLACGVALTDAGIRVIVLERAPAPGGRASSCADETTGDRIDIGPHILLSEYRNMLQLMARLGTHDKMLWHTREFITLVEADRVDRMYMHRLPAPFHFLPSMLRVPAISFQDLLSNRRVLWLAMNLHDRDVDRLDTSNAREFLVKFGVTDRFIDWYWRTVAFTIMNVPLELCSAGALMRFFQQMIGHTGYEIGFPAVSLGELVTEPAVRAIEAAGGEVRLHSEVATIEADGFAVAGVRLADGTLVKARACIACVPPQELPQLIPSAWAARYSLFRNAASFQPSPYVSSYIWFSRKLTNEPFWARVWSPQNLNYDSYDLANIREGWQDRGSVIASNLIFSGRAGKLDDAEIVAATIDELETFLPDVKKAEILHARVNRIPMAIPAPLPGSERLRPQTRTPVSGLFLAGDWIGTGLPASMESAVCAGNRSAERAAQFLGKRLRVALPVRQMEGLAGWLNRRSAP